MKRTESRFDAPIFAALKDYCSRGTVPFHMPGHKQGNAIPKEFFKLISQIDLTELPGLDNLHWPEGPIRCAEELVSETFRADHSYLLVNGSTSGLLAAVTALCKPGNKVIVQRDCHSSVVNGLTLAGAEPIFVKGGYVRDFCIPDAISREEFVDAIRLNPDASAVIVTRPSYYGICCNLKPVVEAAHDFGMPVIVDEAHGAHFGFADFLPLSAMDLGADISVQSAHKTLPCLTQGAYLHLKGNLVDRERLEHNLRIFQTTSPSYVIMASLDLCRAIMQADGKRLLDRLNSRISAIIKRFEGNEYIRILNSGHILDRGNLCSHTEHDRTRLVFNFRKLGIEGFKAMSLLYNEYGIQPEMADLNNVVFIAALSDTEKNLKELADAVEKLIVRCLAESPASTSGENHMVLAERKHKAFAERNIESTAFPDIPERLVSLKEAYESDSIRLAIEKAIGRVSKNMLVPYPPGVPVVWPGERITGETAEYVRKIFLSGGKVNGLFEDMSVNVLISK